jgi:transcriptional regulator
MYNPPAFREERVEVLYDAIQANPLGTLITCGSAGLMANVVPFILRQKVGGDTLLAHLAKANHQIDQLREQSQVLVVFQGPQAYITPSWYATKQEHGKVVPTWNYVIVQARGAPVVIDDADWLRSQIDELTEAHERDRALPWSVDDAPEKFLAGTMKGIVGLELPIDSIEGKWKVSQNQPERNRKSVERGLRNDGRHHLADLVGRG